MNLETEIVDFLNRKNDWEILQKVYYIYIKLCEIFSYNNRYLYDEKNKEKIYKTRININFVEKFEIVCSTWCYLMKDILSLLDIDSNIEHGNRTHVFLVVELPPYKIKMDSMELGHDLSRVKLGNTTTGFIDMNHNADFKMKIEQYDQTIRKEKMTYVSESFRKLQSEMEEENYFQNNKFDSSFSNEIFKSKISLIKDFINYTNKIQRYSDYFYYLNYLVIKIMTELENNKIYNHTFWNVYDDENWDILNLILLELYEAPAICYKMSKKANKYEMNRITKDEMNYYLDNYNGKIKGLYRVFDVN